MEEASCVFNLNDNSNALKEDLVPDNSNTGEMVQKDGNDENIVNSATVEDGEKEENDEVINFDELEVLDECGEDDEVEPAASELKETAAKLSSTAPAPSNSASKTNMKGKPAATTVKNQPKPNPSSTKVETGKSSRKSIDSKEKSRVDSKRARSPVATESKRSRLDTSSRSARSRRSRSRSQGRSHRKRSRSRHHQSHSSSRSSRRRSKSRSRRREQQKKTSETSRSGKGNATEKQSGPKKEEKGKVSGNGKAPVKTSGETASGTGKDSKSAKQQSSAKVAQTKAPSMKNEVTTAAGKAGDSSKESARVEKASTKKEEVKVDKMITPKKEIDESMEVKKEIVEDTTPKAEADSADETTKDSEHIHSEERPTDQKAMSTEAVSAYDGDILDIAVPDDATLEEGDSYLASPRVTTMTKLAGNDGSSESSKRNQSSDKQSGTGHAESSETKQTGIQQSKETENAAKNGSQVRPVQSETKKTTSAPKKTESSKATAEQKKTVSKSQAKGPTRSSTGATKSGGEKGASNSGNSSAKLKSTTQSANSKTSVKSAEKKPTGKTATNGAAAQKAKSNTSGNSAKVKSSDTAGAETTKKDTAEFPMSMTPRRKEPVQQVKAYVDSLLNLEYDVKVYCSFYCVACPLLLPTTQRYEEHLGSNIHKQNVVRWRICQDLQGEQLKTQTTRQLDVENFSETIVGADQVVEVCNTDGVACNFICVMCATFLADVDALLSHLTSFQHIENYMEKADDSIFKPPAVSCSQFESVTVSTRKDDPNYVASIQTAARTRMTRHGRGSMRSYVGDKYQDSHWGVLTDDELEETVILSLMEQLFAGDGSYMIKWSRIDKGKSVGNETYAKQPNEIKERVVGLQSIVEIWFPDRRMPPVYYCSVCNYMVTNVTNHCTVFKHWIEYFKRCYKSIADCLILEADDEEMLKELLVTTVQRVLQMEGSSGRIQDVIQVTVDPGVVFCAVNAQIAKQIVAEMGLKLTAPKPGRSVVPKKPASNTKTSTPANKGNNKGTGSGQKVATTGRMKNEPVSSSGQKSGATTAKKVEQKPVTKRTGAGPSQSKSVPKANDSSSKRTTSAAAKAVLGKAKLSRTHAGPARRPIRQRRVDPGPERKHQSDQGRNRHPDQTRSQRHSHQFRNEERRHDSMSSRRQPVSQSRHSGPTRLPPRPPPQPRLPRTPPVSSSSPRDQRRPTTAPRRRGPRTPSPIPLRPRYTPPDEGRGRRMEPSRKRARTPSPPFPAHRGQLHDSFGHGHVGQSGMVSGDDLRRLTEVLRNYIGLNYGRELIEEDLDGVRAALPPGTLDELLELLRRAPTMLSFDSFFAEHCTTNPPPRHSAEQWQMQTGKGRECLNEFFPIGTNETERFELSNPKSNFESPIFDTHRNANRPSRKNDREGSFAKLRRELDAGPGRPMGMGAERTSRPSGVDLVAGLGPPGAPSMSKMGFNTGGGVGVPPSFNVIQTYESAPSSGQGPAGDAVVYAHPLMSAFPDPSFLGNPQSSSQILGGVFSRPPPDPNSIAYGMPIPNMDNSSVFMPVGPPNPANMPPDFLFQQHHPPPPRHRRANNPNTTGRKW